MGGRRWLGGLLGGVAEGLGSSVGIRIYDCLRATGDCLCMLDFWFAMGLSDPSISYR